MNKLRMFLDKLEEKRWIRLRQEDQRLWISAYESIKCHHSTGRFDEEMPIAHKFAIRQIHGDWIHLTLRVCTNCGIPYWKVEEDLEPVEYYPSQPSHVISAQQATLLLSAELCRKAAPMVESYKAAMLAMDERKAEKTRLAKQKGRK